MYFVFDLNFVTYHFKTEIVMKKPVFIRRPLSFQ